MYALQKVIRKEFAFSNLRQVLFRVATKIL